MKTVEPASLTIQCFCRRCGKPFSLHFNTEMMRGLKATFWRRFAIESWEDFERLQKHLAVCDACRRRLRQQGLMGRG
jgi:hypothetical protein